MEDRRLLAVAEMVEDIVPLRGINNELTAGSNPSNFVEVAGTAYFAANEFSTSTSNGLWRLDTNGDARRVGFIPPDPIADTSLRGVANLINVGETLFFTANTLSVGLELWRLNSQGVAEVVEDSVPGGGIAPGSSAGISIPTLVNFNGTLYFSAQDSVNGTELWRFNSSTGLAEIVEDSVSGVGINPGTGSVFFTSLDSFIAGNTLYFFANDGTNGEELWRINNANGLAEMIEDAVPGGGIRPGSDSSAPANLFDLSGTLFFAANDGANGVEVWRINSLGNAEMVEDSVPGGGISPSSGSSVSSYALTQSFFNRLGTLYFAANDGTTGTELWRVTSSGTAERVNQIGGTEINPGTAGSAPGSMMLINNVLYFSATNATNGTELWRINGSGEAELVEDVVTGDGGVNSGTASSSPSNLTNISGTLYFAATQAATGQELWRINGSGIAEMVEDGVAGGGIAPGTASSVPRGVIQVNGTIYFGANDGTSGTEFWRINGSNGIAEMIEDSVPGGGIRPGLGSSLSVSSSISPVVSKMGTVYLIANDGTSGFELWRMNSSGTVEMVDDSVAGPGIAPGVASSLRNGQGVATQVFYTTAAFQTFGNRLYFRATNGLDGVELWRVGAEGLAEMVEDDVAGDGINSAPAASTPGNFTISNGTLYFGAVDGIQGIELWRVNGAGVAERVDSAVAGQGINPDSSHSNPLNLTNLNNKLYFSATDGTNGVELWTVNNSGSAIMIEDSVAGGGIAPGSTSSIQRPVDASGVILPGLFEELAELTEVNGTIYFRAQRSTSEGIELWRVASNGIAEIVDAASSGTGINTQFFLGHANPINLFNGNGTLYFSANDGTNGVELWRVNAVGIAEMVEDAVAGGGLNPGSSGSSPQDFSAANGTVYFSANTSSSGREVWRIRGDGVAEMVEDSVAGGGIGVGSTSGFSTQISNSSLSTNLKRKAFTESNGTLYFRATTGSSGFELWRVGSSGIAEMVDDAIPGNGINPAGNSIIPTPGLTSTTENVNGTLYFYANDGTSGYELWRVNDLGTAVKVGQANGASEINPGPSGAFFGPTAEDITPRLLNANGTLYFKATNADVGSELWRINGDGLAEVVQGPNPGGGIAPGNLSANPVRITNINGTVYFGAEDGTSGFELWRVAPNGLAEMIDDGVAGAGIRPGVDSSVSNSGSSQALSANNLFVAELNGTVYFNANDGTNGFELWRIAPNVPPTDIALSSNSISENQTIGTSVGTLSTIDGNSSEQFTYSFVSGTGDDNNGAFAIVGNVLNTSQFFNFEVKSEYSVRIRSTDFNGAFTEKAFVINVQNVNASVSDRRLFYNRSTSSIFGNGSGNPVAAVDTDKSALLPGQTAGINNYTNYLRGLNGLLVDIAGLGLGTSTADFQFAVWDGISPSGFEPSPAAPTVSLLPNGGAAGSTRLKIEFDDEAIRNTWLRVTVLANANTDLPTNDVFYFGNAVGDMNAGNLAGPPVLVRTNATDTAIVRQNQSPTQNSVPITSLHDLNKDGRVNATDTALVRQNQTPTGSIVLITAPLSVQFALESLETPLAATYPSIPPLGRDSFSAEANTKPIESRTLVRNPPGPTSTVYQAVAPLNAGSVERRLSSPSSKESSGKPQRVNSIDAFFAGLKSLI